LLYFIVLINFCIDSTKGTFTRIIFRNPIFNSILFFFRNTDKADYLVVLEAYALEHKEEEPSKYLLTVAGFIITIAVIAH